MCTEGLVPHQENTGKRAAADVRIYEGVASQRPPASAGMEYAAQRCFTRLAGLLGSVPCGHGS